jgi:hypothetical protein
MDLYPEPRGREASVEYVAGPGLLMLPGRDAAGAGETGP